MISVECRARGEVGGIRPSNSHGLTVRPRYETPSPGPPVLHPILTAN